MTTYNALQRLWHPAGSGYGKSATTTPRLKDQKVLATKGPVGSNDTGPELKKMNSAEVGLVNRHAACIEFYSIASAESAKFVPMDVEYTESFTSEWNHVSVYGRNDPLSTFQGTQRKISLSFVVNATSAEHARSNMLEIANLSTLLYPTYKTIPGANAGNNNASQIHTAPLLRVHFNNLILDPTHTTDKTGVNGMAKHVGLVCAASDLQIQPVFENGVIATGGNGGDMGWSERPGAPKDKRIYPKTFKIQTNLTVFHTFPMGFERDYGSGANGGPNAYDRTKRGFGAFPWGEKHVYGQDYVKARNAKREAQSAREKKRAMKAAAKITESVTGFAAPLDQHGVNSGEPKPFFDAAARAARGY